MQSEREQTLGLVSCLSELVAYRRRFTRKKCPKGFSGILKKSMPLGVDPVLDQHLKRILSPDHPPVSVKFSTAQHASEEDTVLRGNHIINISSIVSFVSMVSHCPQHLLSISEEPGTLRGMVSRICVKCKCGWFSTTSLTHTILVS